VNPTGTLAVDVTAPTVSAMAYGTNDGTLALGESVTLTVTLSEVVTVTGTPTLALANGGTATYTGGTGTNTLRFNYTPGAGQATSDLATAAANALTGTIKDLAGNAVASAGFNGVNPTGTLAVDVTAPTVSAMAYGTHDGTLALGESVTLTVTLSEVVTVTGTPTLALANGGTATYTGGTGTNTLRFNYTPGAGQATSDLATAAANALTGTIKDLAGNAVASAGFNGVNPTGTLAVDVTAPTLSSSTPAASATAVAVANNIILSFGESVRAGSGNIVISNGTDIRTIAVTDTGQVTISGTTVTINPKADLLPNSTYTIQMASGVLKDLAGNSYAGITNAATLNFTTVTQDLTVSTYGQLQTIDVITPIEAKSSFYQDVGTLSLNSQWAHLVKISDASASASTVINTSNGALIGFGAYDSGRVAVIGSNQLMNDGLGGDPSQGGMARAMFNLFSWLSNQSRSVAQHDVMHVLSLAGEASINTNQSLFWEYLNNVTGYKDPQTSGAAGVGSSVNYTDLTGNSQISADQYANYPAAGRYSDALMPNGAWNRNYAVVVIRADALDSEVQLVRQWMHESGGGLLIDNDDSITMSAAVRQLMADVGLSSQPTTHISAGDYSPTKVDPTHTAFVLSELAGITNTTMGTATQPIYVQTDLKLPTEILGGTVSWHSLDNNVISDTGRIIGTGAVRLEALGPVHSI
jgi:hypothetical protein